MKKVIAVLILFSALATAQIPQDIRGFDKFTWGMPISQAALIYPNILKASKVPRHGQDEMVERLHASRFPIGQSAMSLAIYTHGDADGIAQIRLSLLNGDSAQLREAYVIMVFAASLGSPYAKSVRGASWHFPSTSIYVSGAGDSVLFVIFRPVSEDQQPVVAFPQ